MCPASCCSSAPTTCSGWLLPGAHGKAATIAAVVLDLAVLGIFKYLDVALGSSASLISGLTGEPVEWGVLGLVLPLAISFVTFTLIGYVVDVYRGAPPERDPLAFAVFIAFFPRVLAGPIMRGHEFLPQLRFHRRLQPRASSTWPCPSW